MVGLILEETLFLMMEKSNNIAMNHGFILLYHKNSINAVRMQYNKNNDTCCNKI